MITYEDSRWLQARTKQKGAAKSACTATIYTVQKEKIWKKKIKIIQLKLQTQYNQD